MKERQPDFECLQQFARRGDQPAFRTLVHRHVDLVFATAVRKTSDAGGAEEITQNVFGALAGKAWQFAPDDSLPAWLHKAALLESQAWLRREARRRRREQTAAELGTTMKTPDDAPAVRALVPLLDDALLSLREKDRTALLLRFYERHSLRDVGAALGVSDDAAQKRVQSALERLSEYFRGRGYTTASVAAAMAVLQGTASSASASAVSLAAGASALTGTSLWAGLTALFARAAGLSKLQTLAICVAATALPAGWEWNRQHSLEAALRNSRAELVALESESTSVEAETLSLRERTSRVTAQVFTNQAALAVELGRRDQIEVWRQGLREKLMSDNYQWPEDSAFVRIPKSVLPSLNLSQPVVPPGRISQEARELFGLSPGEREHAESVLRNHFEAVNAFAGASFYQTNRPSRGAAAGPAGTVANVWVIPPLGAAAEAQFNQFHAEMVALLGPERAQFLERELGSTGVGTLRSLLGLDMIEEQRELIARRTEQKGEPAVSYELSGGNPRTGSYWSSGLPTLPLRSFQAAREHADEDRSVEQWRAGLGFIPPSVRQSVVDWTEREAGNLLDQGGNP